jgi:hypothetical protein
MTWRRHSCLRRRNSSRRSGTVDAARQEGRDESRPSRQECLRHENGLIPNSTTSGVLNTNDKTAPLRSRLSKKFRGIRHGVTEPGPEGTPQGSGFLSFATETSQ